MGRDGPRCPGPRRGWRIAKVGHSVCQGHRAEKGAARALAAHTPLWREQKGRSLSTINLYYWYYGAYALFQYGGQPWDRFRTAMTSTLCDNQRSAEKGDNLEVDGSWDPIGEWGVAGGRVYATAVGAMTLEVFYRFQRAQEGIGS